MTQKSWKQKSKKIIPANNTAKKADVAISVQCDTESSIRHVGIQGKSTNRDNAFKNRRTTYQVMIIMNCYAPNNKVANTFSNQIHFILLKWPQNKRQESQPAGQRGPLVGHIMALRESDHYKRIIILITEMRPFGGVKSEQRLCIIQEWP